MILYVFEPGRAVDRDGNVYRLNGLAGQWTATGEKKPEALPPIFGKAA